MSKRFEIGDRVRVVNLGALTAGDVENEGVVIETGDKLMVEYDDGRRVIVHPSFVFHAPSEVTDTEIYGAGS